MRRGIEVAADSDTPDVLFVERAAFGHDKEAELVRALLSDPTAQPAVSLLAREDDRPVGHVLLNPKSGGGKVEKFRLDDQAAALGAEVALLAGPTQVDVADLARKAVADGADLLGVAGGDGAQALVAGIASEHNLPFLVVSAGTRNHFAMDLGLRTTRRRPRGPDRRGRAVPGPGTDRGKDLRQQRLVRCLCRGCAEP